MSLVQANEAAMSGQRCQRSSVDRVGGSKKRSNLLLFECNTFQMSDRYLCTYERCISMPEATPTVEIARYIHILHFGV